MKVSEVAVDAQKTLGSKLWLVDVVPVYEYIGNERTNRIIAYRYMVVLPERKLDKLAVKIEGPAQMETPNGYVEVEFDELTVGLRWSRGDYVVSAEAKGVHERKAGGKQTRPAVGV